MQRSHRETEDGFVYISDPGMLYFNPLTLMAFTKNQLHQRPRNPFIFALSILKHGAVPMCEHVMQATTSFHLRAPF